MGIRTLLRAGSAAVTTIGFTGLWAVNSFAETLGKPTDGAMGLQPSASSLKEHASAFHDHLVMPIITFICIFVLALLIWIVVFYNKRANPKPAKFSHNTLIEIIWTVLPVLILVVIGISSMRLLREYNDMPPADVVVKVTGNQWYWTYDYPELEVTDVESRLLPEAADLKTAREHKLNYLLDVDNRLIVPVGKVVQLKVTATDVIHSFAMPAFGVKIDAVPGRLNDAWFRADKVGVFYGQCSELCGKDHAYMPIAIEVVSEVEFDAYIVKNGGKTRTMIAAAKAQEAAFALTATQEVSASSAPEAQPLAGKPAAALSNATPKSSPAASSPVSSSTEAAPAAEAAQ